MDSVQDPQQNLPPTIMPTTEETVPPPPPTPVVEPSRVPTPVPASDNAQVVNQKKKWGTGALIGSVAALMVLVVGLGVAVFLSRQPQKFESKAYSSANTNLCAQAGQQGICSCFNITNNECIYKRDPARNNGCFSVDGNGNPWYIPGTEWFCGSETSVPGSFSYGCEPGWFADSSCNNSSGSSNTNGGQTCNLDQSWCGGGTNPTSPPPPQGCTINARIMVSADGTNFSDASGTTVTLPYGTTRLYFKGVNGATGNVSPKVTARMVWNNDAYKGTAFANQVGQEPIPGPNGFPTRFEACENTGDPQMCIEEAACYNLGGVNVSTTPPASPTPTPTPVPGSACQRIDVLRSGVVITKEQVQVGDQIVFRGFASADNTTVTAINFAVSQDTVVTSYAGTSLQLVGSLWQADSPVITIAAANYSVTATPIYP